MPLFHDNAFPDSNNNFAVDSDDILDQILSSKAAEFQRTATLDGNIPVQTNDPTLNDDSDDQLDSFNDPFFSSQLSPTPAFSIIPFASNSPSSSSSPTTQVQPTSSVSPTQQVPSSSSLSPSPSLDASNQGNNTTTTTRKSGVSGAAIGVTVTIIILLVGIAAFFLVRKKYIANRMKKRSTWVGNSISPSTDRAPQNGFHDMESADEKMRHDEFETIDINEKHGPHALPDEVTERDLELPRFNMPTPPPALHPTGLAPPRMPSPPPVMLTSPNGAEVPVPIGATAPSVGNSNNPLISATPFAPIPVPRASVASSSVSSALGAQIATGTLVVVARTFVPSLPDELSIQTGEQVRIITKFDDGWAHVERMRSGAGVENGVVPSECLEEVPGGIPQPPPVPGMGLTQEAVEGWRLSKRKSSLHPTGPAQY